MTMRVQMPTTQTEFYPLEGGLDLISAQLAIKPGRAIGATNYEVSTQGGYTRVNGYERFDGRPKPSAAATAIVFGSPTFPGAVAAGQTLNGQTSGATGKVIIVAADRSYIVMTRTTGAFTPGENIRNGTTVLTQYGASSTALTGFDDNTFSEAAANDYRQDILAVPGSGPVRGVWVLNDVVYAFRNNSGGTQCLMYRATAFGWEQIALGSEIRFSAGDTNVAIVEGQTITGATSGATAVVRRVCIESGQLWASGTPCAGRLVLAAITGTFQNGENLNVSGTRRATSASLVTAITLQPGGNFQFDNYSFTGAANAVRMYGCDGVNRAFEFDGTTFAPIRTGMVVDAPQFIRSHRNMLFLVFNGSIQFSSIGEPFRWSVILGAGEFAIGEVCTGLMVMSGSQDGSALMVFGRNSIRVLYGTSSVDFKLVSYSDTTGARAYSQQLLGTVPMYLDDIGITVAPAAQEFGNFAAGAISEDVRPLLSAQIGSVNCSTVVRKRNQYKLFFADGTGMTVTMRAGKPAGILPFNYPVAMTCVCNAEVAADEVVLMGGADGFVYEMNKGRSFDGQNVYASLRLAFNHSRSPRIRKRYRKAIFELEPISACEIAVQPEYSFGTADNATNVQWNQQSPGLGGRWDRALWDRFYWDSTEFSSIDVKLDGVGINLSFLIFTDTATEMPHTIKGVTLHFTPRRLER